MKRCCIAVLALLMFAPTLRGEDEQWKKYKEIFVGDWVQEHEIEKDMPEEGVKKGEKFISRITVKSAAGGRGLQFHADIIYKNQVVGDSKGLMYWDEEEKQVVAVGVDSFGGHSNFVSTIEGSTIHTKGTQRTPEGETKTTDDKSTVEITADGRAIEVIEGDEKGKITVLKRVKKADESLWTNFSEKLLRDGGQSTGKGEITNAGVTPGIEKGDKFTVKVTFRPTSTPNAIVATFRLTIDGKPAVESVGQELIGWNPATKTVDVVNYWSSGMVETISFDRCEGSTFFGTYSSHTPSGEVATSDVSFVFDEEGNADFIFMSGPNKGKTLSSWKRVPAADAK